MNTINSINHALPPGSMGYPFIGESLSFFLESNFILKRHQLYGNIFKTHLFGHPYVFMIGPEAAEFILDSHFDHFNWRDGWPKPFEKMFGGSLLLQDGAEHKRNRKLLMPAFHGAALSSYVDTIERVAFFYLNKWEQQPVCLVDFFETLFLTIVSNIILGADTHTLGANTHEDVRQLGNLISTVARSFTWFHYRGAVASRRKIEAFLRPVIQQRRLNPTNDALSLLITAKDEDGQPLSDSEIITQVILLLTAGYESTASMFTWLCLDLAWNPIFQDKTRSEQLKFSSQGTPWMDQLKQMPYLDQVLLEVERLRPPVPQGFRGVVKPFNFNGYHVPSGWKVQYSIVLTHQAKDIYTNPEKFDPDRFSPERQESRKKPYSLIGFGGGSRSCLGMALAKLEMKMVMALLLRNYRWRVFRKRRFMAPFSFQNNFLRQWYGELEKI